MQFRSKFLFISMFVVASFLSDTIAFAARPAITSSLLLNAGIEYDSNFYYDAFNKIGVTTYLVQPGFQVGLSTGKSQITFRYTLDANYYNESGEDNFYGHTAFLLGDFEMTDRLSLNLSDNYIDTRDSAELDPLGNIASRDQYYKNTFNSIFTLDFRPKFATKFGYMNQIVDYDEDTNEDSLGNLGIFDLIYYMNSSTSLDLEYHYLDMNYDGPSSDYSANQLSFVGRKEWRILAMEAAVGYQNREFDQPDLESVNVVPYRLTLKGATSSGKSRFTLSAAKNFNLYDNNNDGYYEAHRFSLSLAHDLTSRITLGLSGYFQNSDYINVNRVDNTYKIMADLSYLITEKFSFYYSVGFENRDSDIASDEYENGVTYGQLRYAYDIAK